MEEAAESTATVIKKKKPLDGYPQALAAAIGVLAVVSLVLQHGFPIGQEFRLWFNWFDVGLAVVFFVAAVRPLRTQRQRRKLLHEFRFEYLLLATFVLGIFLTLILPRQDLAVGLELLHLKSLAALRFGLVQLFLLGNVCVQMLHFLQRIFAYGVRPQIILAGSFGCLIILGTLLLLLPRANTKPDQPLALIDAFFTATSATCVTGLVVRDTGTDFSTMGQMIILSLFQLGGLGVITFVAFISVFSAKALPVPQMIAFRQIINAPGMNDLKRRLVGIVLLTLLFELSGVVSLFYFFAPSEVDPLGRLHWSVFHSVSAFCNAGFALQGDSLESLRSNVGINVTIMGLIIVGSLGFLVIPELIEYFRGRIRASGWRVRSWNYKFLRPKRPRLTAQTRMSLWVTFWLILLGTVSFWLLEYSHLLARTGTGEGLLISAFQSVTTRTAGFNTITIGDVQPATLIVIMILMVIGGSPVSTSGGIKTLTFGILLLSLRAMILQKDKVEAFGRTLPQRGLITALSVFVLYIMTAAVGFFLLTVFDPQIPLRDLGFEMISALSTVGLSTGITAELSTGSKIVLCIAMFIGRVGPISLVLSVFQARKQTEYDFPDEDVIVG